MKTIEFELTEPLLWYKLVQNTVPSKLSNNTLIIDENLGNGFIQSIEMQKNFWIQQISLILYNEFKLVRVPKKINDFFVIDFYLYNTSIKKEIGLEIYQANTENTNLLLTSATTPVKFLIPKNETIEIYNIGFTKDWLYENVIVDHDHAYAYFDTNDPIIISENMDEKLKMLVKKINLTDNKIFLTSIALQIIDYIFTCVKKRNITKKNSTKIHPDDVSKIMKVKSFLDENPNINITLENLAEKSGMSLSKFKRLFKQIFGITPYQYHLTVKLEKSMDILKNNAYNVSEVGYLMGYSNLSKFSKSFKKHFGMLPSEVKKKQIEPKKTA